ncbi:RNA-binding protein 28 [Linum perenne]
MGKKGKARENGSKDSGNDHSPSTVFVTNLPYSFTKEQLEEKFSDVGPIRRCFMVTPKGSTEHRGTAFVQFAVSEDANRAIELKNDTSIEGRKIAVKHALQRATLEQRRAKAQVMSEGKLGKDVTELDASDAKKVDDSVIDEVENDTTTLPTAVDKHPPKLSKSAVKKEAKKATQVLNDLNDKVDCSEKQRVARTVIVGGLVDDVMADDVHALSKGVGTVCSVTYPLPQEILGQHGLAQDGCRSKASAILFTSVKEARTCVRQLHQRQLKGGTVWARQLGGEGSKAQKWKIIIRNLPFKAKANEIRELFSSAGFVWDVYMPLNSDTGLPKGFAFVKFTCKKDVENAIQKFNGQKFGNRPIAVDWAIPKKLYDSGANASQQDQRNVDSDSSGDDLEDDDDSDSDGDSADEHAADDVDASNETGAPKKADLSSEVNFEEEADIARKVLQNLIASSNKGSDNSQMDDAADGKDSDKPANLTIDLNNDSSNTLPEKANKTRPVKAQQIDGEDDLQRTIFINNLPFDVDTEEVKQRFSAFGEVLSFFPVLHPVTKRPRGTGFLKFKTAEAATAAISAANVTSGLGISLKGRQLAVLKTLDKKAAHEKEVAKSKVESQDQRNLYLAKEGLILEGTPAAKGVSDSDIAKRKSLQEKKTTKLKSPNFHVSRTRLIIYNVPKTMSELALKKLCIKAVISRATKQKPVIKQVKLLKRLKDGKVVSNSRGVAFLEFTEHEHALVALRVLNNNPETFGPEHRPIVEFALDNIQTMKLRETRRQFQHQQGHDGNSDDVQKNTDASGSDPNAEDRFRKRKFQDETRPVKNNFEPNRRNSDDGSSQDQRRFKKHERNPASENREETQTTPDVMKSGAKKKGSKHKLREQEVRKPTSDELRSKPASNVSDSQPRNRKRPGQNQQNGEEQGMKERKRPKKNKDQDKLDLLIEQYRTKFSKPKNAENQQKKPLKRWFQS